MAKKCDNCDEPARVDHQDKHLCWKHYSKATRFSRFAKYALMYLGGAASIMAILEISANMGIFFKN